MRGLYAVRCLGTAAVFAVAVGLLIGCSGGSESGEVSGTVTYDGKPVEDGAINFFPSDGKSSTAGDVIKNGKYSAKKVPVGKMKVTISGSKVVGKKKVYDTKDSPEMPVTQELLPAKYNTASELTLDVKSGSNEKNWELAR
jgi:hypothetical protein